MTIAELLAKHHAELKATTGDKAYTMYHGIRWEGTLELHGTTGRGQLNFDPKTHRHGWPHREPMILVGYDEPIRFDVEAGTFYAPADAD